MCADQDAFIRLTETIERLLAPNGCPWDRKQTVLTLVPMVLEEAAEVLDALHEKDQAHLLDELGDLAVTFLFICKVAENEGRFSWDDPFVKGAEKLIRRHPHIFATETNLTSEEVVQQWDEIKKEETFHSKRKSCLDGVPENLPLVARFQKLFTKIKKASPQLYQHVLHMLDTPSNDEEFELGRKIVRLIFEASDADMNLEVALRGVYSKIHSGVIRKEQNDYV
jgi:tetrapyrrole methylase family protein / MazG family protein